jgi:hypothetical protein
MSERGPFIYGVGYHENKYVWNTHNTMYKPSNRVYPIK